MTTQAIGYRCFNSRRNFGDAINPYIIELVTGLPPVVVTKSKPHVLPIGSIFFSINPNSYVWGSGIIRPDDPLPEFDPRKITALRGRHTRDVLRSLGHEIPDVPLGDPGIFVSDLIKNMGIKGSSSHRLAVVPHWASANHDIFSNLSERDDIKIVDMRTDKLNPIVDILNSDVVASQSLHGLVFAAALGKPYVWISSNFSDKWKFKFYDWFTMCDNPQPEPLDLETSIDDLIKAADFRPSTIDKDALISAFPKENTIIEVDTDSLIHHETCRNLSPAISYKIDYPVKSPTKLSSIAEDKLHQIETYFKNVFNQEHKNRALPIYQAIIGNKDITKDHCAIAASYLDARSEPIASVVLMSEINTLSDFKIVKASEKVYLTKAGLLGASIVIRPNGQCNLGKGCLTVIIDDRP